MRDQEQGLHEEGLLVLECGTYVWKGSSLDKGRRQKVNTSRRTSKLGI